jgi:hypothetical protein
MTHLTLTGFYAGHPLCDSVRNAEEQYIHAAYAPIEKLANGEIADYQPLCDKCLAAWNED